MTGDTLGAVKLKELAGSYADNKDIAREIRIESVLPLLAARAPIVLDFTGVTDTTQSFVHACISEAIRKFGIDALKLIEFRKCNNVVRGIIETVVAYSLHVLDNDPNKVKRIPSIDIPQADNLDAVRQIVQVVAQGCDTFDRIVAKTCFDSRQVEYRSHAARILGFLEVQPRLVLTAVGKRLVQTRPSSERERQMFEEAVLACRVINMIAPELCDKFPPTKRVIADRIMDCSQLGDTTALRRAGTILAWRERIMSRQLLLFTPYDLELD